MARRCVPKGPIHWYLKEWMDACGLSGRGAQAKMMELTGWSKATMSQLYNGTQDYSPKVVNDAARALNVEPYELLMQPSRAMRIRQFLKAAEDIVEIERIGVATDEGVPLRAPPLRVVHDNGTHG